MLPHARGRVWKQCGLPIEKEAENDICRPGFYILRLIGIRLEKTDFLLFIRIRKGG